MSDQPNVLFVFSDQHRADALGCYGNAAIRTPNFDRLAADGVRATTAISNTPVCCPYRASLMTGKYAFSVGMPSNGQPFLPDGPCVANVFHDAGYATGYIGKWHLFFPDGGESGQETSQPGDFDKQFVPPDQRLGFDDYWRGFNCEHRYFDWTYYRDDDPTPIPVHAYQPDYQVDQALEFITDRQSAEQPWCLFMSWEPPHTPFTPPDEYRNTPAGHIVPENVPEGAARDYYLRSAPGYFGLIESLDAAFGRLMAGLEKAGAVNNTIVVYTSDHGEMLGAHGYKGNKRWPYDTAIRIPFIIRWPERIPKGQTIDKPLNAFDVYPTLAELAGLSVPGGLDGKSAANALLTGDESDRDEFAYCPMHYAYVPWPGWRAIRSRRYLYARTKQAPWLLFDLDADPLERCNLVDAPDSKALRVTLDTRLFQAMRDAGDRWDVGVETGDYALWTSSDTSKMIQNNLGVPWPNR